MRKSLFTAVCAALISMPVQAVSLLELYNETINADPRLLRSAAQVDVGEAQSDQAFGALLPQVSMQGTLTDTKREVIDSGATDSFKGEKYSLVVQQPLFDKGKWENNKRYDYLAQQRVEQFNETKALVAVDVVTRYMETLAALDNLRLIQAEREATAKQLAQLRSRYQRQLAVITDVLEVEARLDGIDADEIAARNKVSIAREALAELVGHPIEGELERLQDRIDYIENGKSLEQWIAEGLKNNPTLASLQQEIEAARASVRQARAGHLPTLALQLSAQKSDIGFENAAAPRTETYVAALNFSMPLYSGGSTSARVDEMHAQLVVSQQTLEEEKRKFLKEIREAYLNTEASWARTRAAHKAVLSARKSHEAMQRGFEYGTVTVVDVLDALREQYRFTRDFKQSQYDFVIYRMQLLQKSGSLTEADIRMVDQWLEAQG